ncbi:hypothetical protein TSMEX_002544 [Taenia solium]|eukprot:TsM_000981300 transcript=TsM_000981300 gene=TsM_000981300
MAYVQARNGREGGTLPTGLIWTADTDCLALLRDEERYGLVRHHRSLEEAHRWLSGPYLPNIRCLQGGDGAWSFVNNQRSQLQGLRLALSIRGLFSILVRGINVEVQAITTPLRWLTAKPGPRDNSSKVDGCVTPKANFADGAKGIPVIAEEKSWLDEVKAEDFSATMTQISEGRGEEKTNGFQSCKPDIGLYCPHAVELKE